METNKVEDLRKELEERTDEFDRYIESNDYLSEEAEEKRHKIYELKDKIRLLEKTNDLENENLALYEENKQNRLETEELKLQLCHVTKLLQENSEQLEKLQEIDRRGWAEEEKIKRRNVIINSLIKQYSDIIKELDESGKHI